MKKITVVIPVYNGEKFIDRCVGSLLNQNNFDKCDLEIILLNDGSKDRSIDILNEYKRKYPDIFIIIDKENSGVAKTRNKGIQLATGVFTIFIDQDDYIDNDYLFNFYEAIVNSGVDVVVGGYRRTDISRQVIEERVFTNGDYNKYILMAAWAKIHRTIFLQKNNIRFFDNKYGEDVPFTAKEILTSEKWAFIDYIGYNWFYNEESITNTIQKGLKKGDNILHLLVELKSMLVLSNTKEKDYYLYYVLRVAIYYLLSSGRTANVKRFLKVYQEIFDFFDNEFPQVYESKYLAFGPRGENFFVKAVVSGVLLLRKTRTMKLFTYIYCKG